MSNDLLGLFLSNNFYVKNKHLIALDFFEDESKKIWRSIELGHNKYERDLTPLEVEQILFDEFSTMTTSQVHSMKTLTRSLPKDIGEDIASDVLMSQFKKYFGKKLAELGIEIMDKGTQDLSKVNELIEKYEENFMPKIGNMEIAHDVYSLLKANEDVSKYRWNLKGLHNLCQGIGPTIFTAVFAMVETGKTSFLISAMFGPNGFMEQGAKCMILANEEKQERTGLRAVSSLTNMTKEAIEHYPDKAHEIWGEYGKRVVILNSDNIRTMEDLELALAKHRPDVVGIDQLDKIEIRGVYAREDIRLGEIYRKARSLAKRYDCAVIGVSQASAEAEGRTVLRFTQMAGSKVSKAAEADLVIGIGKEIEEGTDNFLRHIYVSKNKIGGQHGTCTVVIKPEVSRYVD